MRGMLVAYLVGAAFMLLGVISTSLALPPLQPISAELRLQKMEFDVFDDTIRYDNGEVQWWYGGLNNFYLTTRFTCPADFALQRMVVALLDSNATTPLNLWLKEDVSGAPGPVLWSGSLLYNSSETWLGANLSTGMEYTFASGESFWLELHSPGPPYECYDDSQLQLPRSFTNYPTPSPGDNFIRAVGEYTATVVDVGLDSVWHGGIFFAPDSGVYQLEASVHNYGSQAAQFTLSCSLLTASGQPEAFVGSQILNLAAGDSVMFSFPTYTCALAGSHVFRFRTGLPGDPNIYNNTAEIETQIYHIPPSAELRYDDGIPMGAVVTPISGDGWAMRFDPNHTGSYRVDSVRVSVDTTSGNLPSRLQVLVENPGNVSPGAVLWETTNTLSDGWNSLPVDISVSGAFYVAYLFENGSSSPALNYSHFPLSGECWSRMSGLWVKGECLEEWMLRAVIDTGSAPAGPPLWVNLAPNGPTIIPAGGGTLFYILSAGNNGTVGESTDFWLFAILPGGAIYGPMLGPLYNFFLPSGFTISRNRSVIVPAAAPAGSYHLVACLGDYTPPNNTVIASDSLPFQKAGSHGVNVENWLTDGGESAFGELDAETPPNASVMRAFPNPFNAATVIRLQLPKSGMVSLQVYDLMGRLATSLLDNIWLEAGDHGVVLDGEKLPSGIYICRLSAGTASTAQKIILLK